MITDIDKRMGFLVLDRLIADNSFQKGELLFEGVAYKVPRHLQDVEPELRHYSYVKAFTEGDIFWVSGSPENGMEVAGHLWSARVELAPTNRSKFEELRSEMFNRLNLSVVGNRVGFPE